MSSEKLSILTMRLMMALLWLSQGLAKVFIRSDNMYDDFNGFLGEINWAQDVHPLSFVSDLIVNIMIPNYVFFAILVIIVELSIGTSYLLGLFTRLGSLAGGLMAISLWILTLGWGEWIWTYPLIFIPHFVLFFARSGHDFGLDKLLNEKSDNKLLRIIS